MSAGLAIKPHEAAQMGETILAENSRLAAENVELKEKMASIQSRIDQMKETYDKIKEFGSLLDDNAPDRIQIFLTDREVVRKLMLRAIQAFGPKNGQHPDTIDKDNEVLRRRARLNFDRIIAGCLEYSLGAAWNVVYPKYVKRIPL